MKIISFQKLNLEVASKIAKKINSEAYKAKLAIKGADRGWVVPKDRYYDQGMEHIINGRTHSGRGFLK